MLHQRGKARMIEEFIFLYLIGHESITAKEICVKVSKLRNIQMTLSVVHAAIRDLKAWEYIGNLPSNGNYYLTKAGADYYSKDFNEGNFIYFNPDKDNVNI